MNRVAAIAVFLAVSACVTEVRHQETVEVVPRYEADGGMAVVGVSEADGDLADCVALALAKKRPPASIKKEDAFRSALFPWFEPATRPDNPADLSVVIAKPLVKARLAQIGVRYLVAVEKGARLGEEDLLAGGSYLGPDGAMLCGAGGYPPAAGCLGLLMREKASGITAVVWDLREGTRTAALGVRAEGVSVVPAFILPVPLIAPTQSQACRELGDRLTKLIPTALSD